MGGLAAEMKCLEKLVMLAKEGVRSAFLKNLVAHIPTINIINAAMCYLRSNHIIKLALKSAT